MPALEGFARFGTAAAGFVIPLFARRHQANLLQIQTLDSLGRVADFEDIVAPHGMISHTGAAIEVNIGDPALWGFAEANGTIHLGGQPGLREVAPAILTREMIRQWPASAADLIRFCDLEADMPRETREIYAAMLALSPSGAVIWRDADVMLPAVRSSLGLRKASASRRQTLLDHVSVCTRDGVCHVYVPDELPSEPARDDPGIKALAHAWGIERLEFHPFKLPRRKKAESAVRSWPVIGLGGVGRFTVNRMWHAIGPMPKDDVHPRLDGRAVEARLLLPTAPAMIIPCPDLRIVIHGSAERDVEAGVGLLQRGTSIQHVFNIRPLGMNPERPGFITPWRIIQDRDGPDFLWVIGNHRQRRVVHRFTGLAMSQVASRFTRAGITALADLSQSPRGRELLKETSGARAIGLVGAARYLRGTEPEALLKRAVYSMLSPEWTFEQCRRIVALWPRPAPEGSTVFITLGRNTYPVELVGVGNSAAHADVRCLAFDVRERPNSLAGYGDFIVSLMAGWDWQLRSDVGEEMIFEDQGAVISVHPAETRERLDRLLARPPEGGPVSTIIVVNRSLTRTQKTKIEDTGWTVLHHGDLPRWLRENFGDPVFMPFGGWAQSE